MKERKRKLTSLTLAISLGLMTTLAGCEVNSDGGGEGGEGAEQGSTIEQSEGGETGSTDQGGEGGAY